MRIIANRYSDDNIDPQQASDDSKVEQAKNKTKDAARKLATDSEKRKKAIEIITKIAKLLVEYWPVALVILVIIMIIGFVAFMESMPGMMRDKLYETGKSVFTKVYGFFTGDEVSASVKEEEVLGVAEYLQNMGYDLTGYGFGDVTYEEDYEGQTPPTSVGVTKNIAKVTPFADKKNYIKAYISANESTYALATWSIGGAWNSLINRVLNGNIFDKDSWKSLAKATSEGAHDYSTGMIYIEGLTGKEFTAFDLREIRPWNPLGIGYRGGNEVDLTAYAEVDRENAKLIIYNADNFVIHIPFLQKSVRPGGKGSFAYDIDEWLARYGRPTELFLALHISTMMPDLTYEMATAKEFNTKVNLGINEVTVNYYVQWTDQNGKEWKEQDLIDEFIDNISYAIETGDGIPIPQRFLDGYNAIIDKAKSDEKFKLQFYKSCAKSMEANNEEDEISEDSSGGSLKINVVYAGYKAAKETDDDAFVDQLKNYFANPEEFLYDYYWEINAERWRIEPFISKGKQIEDDDGWFERKLKELGSLLGGLIESLSDVITDNTICTYRPLDDLMGTERKLLFKHWYSGKVKNTLGIPDAQFKALHELQAEGVEGVEHVQFPYIASVKKHWYYKDFYFPASKNGVYYKARTASKMIKYDYVNGETERPLEGLDIMLDALLTAEDGNAIYYQVREPYTEGPNDAVKKLFIDNKYYRFDGTPETARNIAKAKAAEGEGSYIFQGSDSTHVSGDDKAWGQLPEKQKASFGTPQDTLSAFSILENVHTENSDWIYRRLKMLLVDLEFYNQDEMSEPLKKVLIWPIQREDDLPRYQPFNEYELRWNVSKSENNYGIEIEDVEGQTVICPGDAEIVSKSGDSVTLKFKALSSYTYDVLDYEYSKRFFKLDRAIVEDYTMTISGITPSVGGGQVDRGKELGTAKEKVKIVMQRPDQSIVGDKGHANEDDIEDFMSQFYTNKHEEELIKRYEDRKEIATDRGGSESGGNEDDDEYSGEKPGDEDDIEYPEPPVGSELDLIYAKVASEAQHNYESALAVISCAANRVDSSRYSGNTLYAVLYAPGQFVGNHNKYLKNGKYVGPEIVKNAVDDCIAGRRNHGFTSFRTDREPQTSNRKASIKADTRCSDSQLGNYCRAIGGNFYFNQYNNHYYKEYTK